MHRNKVEVESERKAPRKKKVWVDESLYDFKDEELEFIAKSREISGDATDTHFNEAFHEHEEFSSEVEYYPQYASSDTESTYQNQNRDVNSLSSLDAETLEMLSNMSTSQYLDRDLVSASASTSTPSSFSFHSFDDFEDIETQRAYPEQESYISAYGEITIISPTKTSAEVEGNHLQDGDGGQSFLRFSDETETDDNRNCIEPEPEPERPRKRIVPEPELSDPNFIDLHDSFELIQSECEGNGTQTLADENEHQTLTRKLSNLTSIRKTYSGGFLGAYVVRTRINQPYASTVNGQVRHDGYFRIWLSKLRNLHLFA